MVITAHVDNKTNMFSSPIAAGQPPEKQPEKEREREMVMSLDYHQRITLIILSKYGPFFPVFVL